jgi:hypothetical protein
MVRRPTMAEVLPVAQALVTASAQDDTEEADRQIAVARVLGGGTREGQTHVNLLLAHALADILDEECPAEWRTILGVPNVVKLNAIDEQQDLIARYARRKAAQGKPVTIADAKARVATADNVAVLAQQFLKVRKTTPERLREFTAAAEGATGLMVDHVWGALWMACGKVRELA